jgi:hypothetical protein
MAGLTATKAKKILSDGTVNGKPLTAKQKAYFGLIAGGGNPSGEKKKKKKRKKMKHNPYHKKYV